MRSSKAAAEARKAESASCTALRIPRPPQLTVKVACFQAGSLVSKQVLVILLTIDLRVLSYSTRTGDQKQGVDLSRYRSFRIEKEFLRLRYTVCSLIIHELLLLFVSSTTLIFMNYAPNMKV